MLTFKSCFAATALVLGCMPSQAAAHPFHISSAEIEYDPGSDRLQVSVKLQAVDLERALAQMSGKRIKLEQAGVDEWVVAYLDRHLYLTQTVPLNTADDPQAIRRPLKNAVENPSQVAQAKDIPPRSRVHWVGSELKGAWIWLYFELELPLTRDDLQLFNTVLFDTNTGQINTVSVRHAGQRVALKLTSQQPSQKFLAQWMTP